MGGLFGGSPQKVSSTAPEVSGLRMQTSARGRAIPLVYGKTRVAANVIWYGDFRAVEHRSRQSAGGKGGGGGSPIETVSYSYEVAVQLALCEGPVRGIGTVWVGKNVGTLGAWNLSQFTGGPGQQPMPYLLSRPALADAALSYRGTAYVGTGLLALGDDPSLPNMSFEVDSTFGLSDSIRDANPADVLADLLGNTRYGLGARADALGDLTALRQWCLAAGLLVSPAYTEQQPARELLSRLLQIAAAGVYYSEGRIKAVPLANSPASGNGVQYSPDLTPAYDLGDDDFLQDGDSDPVQCRRTATADVYNCVRVKFVNRASGYNDETVEAKDPGAIARDGLRLQELDLHELADANVARLVAQLALQRGYVRNRYQFRLGWRFALLEPTDLVTLSDAGLGLTRALVRITEIEEDEDGTLSVQAEEVPIGTVNATRYPTQASNGYAVNHNTPPGAANRPVIFEPPLALAGAPEIWLATSGSSDTWGGCDVWVSDDNATYQRLGRLNGKCRHGVLAAPLPASVGIDTANLLRVDVAAAGGVLLAATQQNADQLVSLCYVDGELLAYRDATLTAPGRYDLGYLVRGAWGTPISSHGTGSAFARLDQSIARFGYDKARVGQTLYIKLQSFNIYGNHTESLAELTAYPYQIKGAALADVTGLALEQPFSGRSCKIRWHAVDGAIAYSVEVWGGSPQALRRSVAVGDTRRYEYSWEDATADGGPWRQISLRVRAISATGVSGNWATVVANNPVPPALTGISVSPGYNAIFFACSQPADLDAAGLRVWLSTVAGFTPGDGSLVYDGPDYSTTLYQLRDGTPLQAGTAYYLRAAAFDAFGKDGLQISSEYTITPVSVAGGLKPGDIDAAMVRALDTAKLTGTLKDWQLESINAAKIAGQLVDGQLAALHAAKLVGQLQDPQIAQLSADKLLGKVQLNQLAADVQGPLASAVSTANQALITANNAASATSVSQLSAQVDALSTNLLPVALWKPGMQALPAPWGNNWNDASEQVIITAAGPYGDAATVLKAVAISGQADGGWNISTPVDRTRAYRFCVWIKDVSGNAGSVYLGIDTVCNPAGVPVWNPYFHVHAKSGLANGRWYLFTGYIYPEGATFPAQAQSAIYDGETGMVVATGSDYAWRPGAELTNPRCYQYYADAGAEQWFAYPRFEALDGREPSIADLLAGTALLNAKAAITRVANVEVAVAGKAAASDVTTLKARVAAAEAGISAANQARADGDAASASSINQVNARMAPGGDIYGALLVKAPQAALDAAVTRIAAAETSIAGKASATEFTQLKATVANNARVGAVLNADPGCLDLSAWVSGGHGPLPDQVAISDGKSSPKVFRSVSGNGRSADGAIGSPCDSTKRYRISCWVRRSADAIGLFYLRYVVKNALGESGTQIAPEDVIVGGFPTEAVTPTTAWTRVEATFRPVAGATLIAPRVILNWNAHPGYHEVQDIRIEEVVEMDKVGGLPAALAAKASQVSLDATNTRVSTVETLANSRASASDLQQLQASVSGSRKEIFVPGQTDQFYPVAIRPASADGATTCSFRIHRPNVHKDGSWLGSYVADITARSSSWGHAATSIMSVFQRTGSGTANWGLGNVFPSYISTNIVVFLRGGMSHIVELLGAPENIVVTMPAADGTLPLHASETHTPLALAEAPLAAYLNKDWRPDGTLAKESVELLPQALNDISAQNTRLATAEAVLGTKASASTVEALQAQVGRRKNYRVTSWGHSYDYRFGAEAPGLYNGDGIRLTGYHRSYVVVRFAADGTVVTSVAFDVYGIGQAHGNGGAAEMAAHLNAMPLGTLVLIYTCDEPFNHRLDSGLPDAIYRCGGTAAMFLSGGGATFHGRSVYVLLGKISGKQGTAFEAYRGDGVNDPAAYLSIGFDIVSGEFVGISPAATASAGAVLNRIQQVEATVAGKASATDISTLQARVGGTEASVTTLTSAQASLDGRVSGKWGVAIEATLPDGRKKLSGLQAFNDGSTASFVISADQLLIQGAGSAINPDPYFQDASCWHTYTGSWGIAKIPDGRAGDYALRSLSRPAEITGARPLPFDPGKNYRVKAWARALEGANGQLYLGVQLLDSNGNNLSGNGTFWYTTITSLTSAWAECVGFIGPNHALVPPSGAKSFRPIALLNYTGTAGYMELQAYEIEEVLPSTLIQNGAITTDKIAANAILADKIAANQISSTHIVVGSLTGDRLAVNSISGDKIQAGTLTANHIDSRNLTIKDAAGNVIFGAGQSLDVGRITGLGALATANNVGVSQVSGLGPLATKAQVAASDMAVGSLSAISANLGTVTAGNLSIQSDGAGGWGKLQSGSKWWYDGQNGWVLAREPGGGSLLEFQGGSTLLRMSSWGDCLLRFGDKIEMRGDGFVRVRRIAVAEPDIVASGTQAVSNSWWLGEDYYWSTGSGDNRESGYGERSRTQIILIDTGISFSSNWHTAASDIYAATATIASGQARNGGGTGYGETSIVIGDGLSSGGGGYIDNRVYIKYVYQHVGQPIFISAVDWKLVRI